MADGGGGERQFLGDIVKNKTKYGSTTKPMPKFKSYVKHAVTAADTLMGIALKYGGTVEVIKRENKLWTNDSLFLREHLFVPVTSENSHLIKDDWEIVKGDEVRCRAGSDLSNSSGTHDLSYDKNSADHSDKRRKESTDSDHKTKTDLQKSDDLANGMDFFNKYDNNIAQLKDNVSKMENSSRFKKQETEIDCLGP